MGHSTFNGFPLRMFLSRNHFEELINFCVTRLTAGNSFTLQVIACEATWFMWLAHLDFSYRLPSINSLTCPLIKVSQANMEGA